MSATAIPLADIGKILVLPGRRGMETWAAETSDGEWSFARLEDAGTTWQVTHKPTRTVVCECLSSLTDCRAYTASGGARADLELTQAHERGEHETERNKTCPKC